MLQEAGAPRMLRYNQYNGAMHGGAASKQLGAAGEK